MITSGFVELQDIASFDLFLAEAGNAPQVIFKHSNACGISSRAFAQMALLKYRVGFVIVQESRAVSAEIERRFGIVHETPQVLIVRGGEALWTASHGQVRVEAILDALASIPVANSAGGLGEG